MITVIFKLYIYILADYGHQGAGIMMICFVKMYHWANLVHYYPTRVTVREMISTPSIPTDRECDRGSAFCF